MDMRKMMMVLGLGAAGWASAAVSVVNGDFEAPVCTSPNWYELGITGWSWSGSGTFGVAAMANQFYVSGTTPGVFGGPLPGPADGQQFAWMGPNAQIWQRVGTVELNRMYRATVAIGRRLDQSASSLQSSIEFRVGSAVGSATLLAITSEIHPSAGTFRDATIMFHTFGECDAEFSGQPLWLVIRHTGSGGQASYDNVSVTETDALVQIGNASFENPAVADGGYASWISGWGGTNSFGVAALGYDYGFTNVVGAPLPEPADGRQFAWVGNNAKIWQPIGAIVPRRWYLVSVAAGHTTNLTSSQTLQLELRAGPIVETATVVAQTTATLPRGKFETVTVGFNTFGKYIALDGQNLWLVIGHSGGPASQGAYDNVSATVSKGNPYNASFELPVVEDGGWSATAFGWGRIGVANMSGVTAIAGEFGSVTGELPAPGEGRQVAFAASGGGLYQSVDMVREGYVYTLTVAHSRRLLGGGGSGPANGTIGFRGGAWDGADIVTLPVASLTDPAFQDHTIRFATTNGLNAELVGTNLFVVLGSASSGPQNIFDNVRYSAIRPLQGVSLTDSPLYENVATDGELAVTGPYVNEIDELTKKVGTGSVVLSQAVPAPTYVMLWLAGGDSAQYEALAQALAEVAGGDVLTVADHDWDNLVGKGYVGFDLLLKFKGQSDIALNWDFGDGYAWDGTVVDKVAVSTKVIKATMIMVK